MVKDEVYRILLETIEQSIATARSAMRAAEDSRDNETKSSVGDKYETGRAMMQIESEKNKVQLIKAIQLKKELTKIGIQPARDKIAIGSLIYTNQGIYFLAIGIGKIKLEKETVFSISPAAPIGRLLNGKSVGDKVTFQQREFEVMRIM